MGQSNRIDRTKCPECFRKDSSVVTPRVTALKKTGRADYVFLECPNCKHRWKSAGETAFRLAVMQRVVTYGQDFNFIKVDLTAHELNLKP